MIREYMNNTLYIDGVNTVKLAQKYGTPLYVMSRNSIAAKCAELRKDFLDKYTDTRVAYACKAFCTLAMCKIIEKEGFGLDVVSGGELFTAIQAEFPAEKIEFNGNNKLKNELELAIDYGVGRIIIDSVEELHLVDQICKEKDKNVSILLRLSPAIEMSGATHEYITTASKNSKFGISMENDDIHNAIKCTEKSPHINFLGFHFHIGSQLMEKDSHIKAVKKVLDLVRNVCIGLGEEIKELNLGGGFGIKYLPKDDVKPFRYFLDPMMELIDSFFSEIKRKRPTIVIEPGRSIVGEAGTTLYTIGGIKRIKDGKTFVSVDGGMTDNIRPGLYQSEYAGIVANKTDNEASQTVDIAGKCCESTDILMKDTHIPDVRPGDVYAMFSTGAYGYAMANNYNRICKPAVVMADNGRDDMIVKRQNYNDLTQNDIIPQSLD